MLSTEDGIESTFVQIILPSTEDSKEATFVQIILLSTEDSLETTFVQIILLYTEDSIKIIFVQKINDCYVVKIDTTFVQLHCYLLKIAWKFLLYRYMW